ncbi:coiled-coil domain-containing protein mtmr15 [Colletotrichum truncatum]|uniref:Coiled-coil domain-containing protein mtmr15 n=1 Tax=Colletotrichum truncatum TaxID=5467 RepID=A0ACC3Z528_COLTU|nr:coiled-coil domain-containing protein mtmr15 [Colletotrichum truncatum]KAF6795071.1 coiled-coil domain-containing protein mtmr15 [Colletotrichum truncatum]
MDAFVQRLPRPRPQSPVKSPTRPSPLGERPAKKVKVEIEDSDGGDDDNSATEDADTSGLTVNDASDDEDEKDRHIRETAIESALPPIQADKEAIEEYELMRSSQVSAADEKDPPSSDRKWVRGKSSIYVDAFNLALDTVLADESHLFNAKELHVFEQWKNLDYEAQYLYVRLFLRKTSAWHRQDRLGYYSDISDPELAIKTLQETRDLPEVETSSHSNPVEGVDLEEFSLSDTFTFADASEEHITTIEEASSLLSLDELKDLAKEAKFQGRNKMDLVKALCRTSHQQTGLFAHGLQRSASGESQNANGFLGGGRDTPPHLARQDSNRTAHFLEKIRAMTGPCIRLSPLTYRLFERVHLVFYRSAEWTEKSLTAIILASIARRSYPDYIVCRSTNIFASRRHVLEFEAAIRVEAEVDSVLEFNGPPGEAGFRKIVDVFDRVYPRWKALLREEQEKEERLYEEGEGAYLRRFTPVHSYTRIIHKAAYVFGKLKDYEREHSLLTELLDQHLFHPARRGSWYQRKALLEEHYMHALDAKPVSTDPDLQKKHWKRIAAATCEAGLQDNDCHLIFHYDLQKRLVKLEKQLRIPRRLQHDFGHVRLQKPVEHTVEGIQLKKEDPQGRNGRLASTKTVWVDEREDGGECSVEEMCLSWYRGQGYKGYHAEGGIVRTLFAYLFYDILFLYIPNVFQTAYQTCPLDLHTDAFYPTRASEINHRLVDIANGGAERIIREVDNRERERRTCVIGLNWDYDVEDLVELVGCFNGSALAAVCKVMAQEYRQRGGGLPDLILWRTEPEKECMFAEVKSANDRLSDTQRLWIHVLTGAGVKVVLCNAVAKEVKIVD